MKKKKFCKETQIEFLDFPHFGVGLSKIRNGLFCQIDFHYREEKNKFIFELFFMVIFGSFSLIFFDGVQKMFLNDKFSGDFDV